MKDKITMILFVLILGGILSSSLVIVDAFTRPLIEKNASIKLKSGVLEALGIMYVDSEIEETFERSVSETEAGERSYFISVSGEIALPFEGSGLWGPIRGILAMGSDLVEIKGVTIIQQEETPGLGSRIAEEPYLSQFVRKRFPPESESGRLEVVSPGKSVEPNQIDSISGATLSSTAFVEILNDEYSLYRELLRGND